MTKDPTPKNVIEINPEDLKPHNVFQMEYTENVHTDGEDELYLFI